MRRRAQTPARPPTQRPRAARPPIRHITVPVTIGNGDNSFTIAELLPGITGSVKMVSTGFVVNGGTNAYIQPKYAGPNYSGGPSDFVAPRRPKFLQSNLNTSFLLNYPPHAPYMSAQDTQHLINIFQETTITQANKYVLLTNKYYELDTRVAPLIIPPKTEEEGSEIEVGSPPSVQEAAIGKQVEY